MPDVKVTERDRAIVAAEMAALEFESQGHREEVVPVAERIAATARAEGRAEALEEAACEVAPNWPCPPDWSEELHDACEVKEDAFNAGYDRGAWVARSNRAAAIRALKDGGAK